MKIVQYLVALLALGGAIISTLALRVHYSTDTQPCSVNERWDCGIVNHSSFAEMAGVPVAAIGIAGYLVLAALALTRARFLAFLASLTGFGFALRLTLIEEYALGVWCLYCVISQVIIALIALITLLWLAEEYIALKRAHRVLGHS